MIHLTGLQISSLGSIVKCQVAPIIFLIGMFGSKGYAKLPNTGSEVL